MNPKPQTLNPRYESSAQTSLPDPHLAYQNNSHDMLGFSFQGFESRVSGVEFSRSGQQALWGLGQQQSLIKQACLSCIDSHVISFSGVRV